jgi:hypothetical protein
MQGSQYDQFSRSILLLQQKRTALPCEIPSRWLCQCPSSAAFQGGVHALHPLDWPLDGEALVINCIIGSWIFGVSSELTRLLGRASPIAMIVAALARALISGSFTF